MAEAYAYAEDPGQPTPAEIQIVQAIDRFGVQAVTGSAVLRPSLINRIFLAENIVNGFAMRARAKNWADFNREHPKLSATLVDAERVAHG